MYYYQYRTGLTALHLRDPLGVFGCGPVVMAQTLFQSFRRSIRVAQRSTPQQIDTSTSRCLDDKFGRALVLESCT